MDQNYRLLGKMPVQEQSPAGQDVRSEPAFERLQAELDKLNSPSLAAQVDWGVVEQAAAEILQRNGKDVLVACYLCYALVLRHGLQGLEVGLSILADMHTTYWDTMYPKLSRMRARKNAIEWLLEKCLALFEPEGVITSQTYSPALIASIQDQLSAIDAVLDAQMPDAPTFAKFRNQVAALSLDEVAEVVVPANVASQAEAVSTAAPASIPPATTTANLHAVTFDVGSDAEQALTTLSTHLFELAASLRSHRSSDCRAYQLNRVAAWASIESLPPSDGRQTAIAAPLEQLSQALERMQSLMLNEEIIEFCENQLIEKPFWLDLQFATYSALLRLGAEYVQAALVVDAETRLLIQRFPELLTLCFNNGSPFANTETQEWLSNMSSAVATVEQNGQSPLASALAASALQAAEANMVGAAQALQDGLHQHLPIAARDKLRAKVQFAHLLLEQSGGLQASAFAADLLAVVQRHALMEWEPALALEVLEVCYKIYLSNDRLGEAQDLLQQIAHLDLVAFTRISLQ